MMNVDDGCFDNDDAEKAYSAGDGCKMSEKKTVYIIGKKGNLCEGAGDCDDSVAEKCADAEWCNRAGREDEMSKKDCAFHALSAAEKAWWAYFCECEVGPERIRAHEIYERIRRATHI